MNEKEFARVLLGKWVETLIGNLDIFMDEETKIQALEKDSASTQTNAPSNVQSFIDELQTKIRKLQKENSKLKKKLG